MTQIAVVNYSSLVKPQEAMLMAQALQYQMYHHVAPLWRAWPALAASFDAAHVPSAAKVIGLFDHADQAGALGYHTEDPNGKKYGKVFVQDTLDGGGGQVLSGAFSVASVLSHEGIELWGDAPCNRWADGPQSRSYAFELCDPVESDWYPVSVGGQTVSVSNFVAPAWFDTDPDANSQLDFERKLSASFAMTPGGYVVYRSYGSEAQDFGEVVKEFGAEYPQWRLAGKEHPASRTKRRSAVVAP